MEAQPQHLAWGIAYAGMMYVIGNGVWVNHLARKKPWLGWLMWFIASVVIIVVGAAIEVRLTASAAGIWQHLTGVDKENHWIVLVLFALMSVPGAASVILKQPAYWTRIALIIPAVVVFIPVGMQLGGNGKPDIIAGLGLALAISAMIFVWQLILDVDTSGKQERSA